MNKATSKIIVITIVAMVIAAIVAAVMFRPHMSKLPAAVNIDTKDQPTIGNPNAKIHIVAFEDLKCFNCKRYTTTIFPQVKQKYIDNGKAKYTLVNLAFVPGSLPAATAARCVYQQDKNLFFPFIDYVYHYQPP